MNFVILLAVVLGSLALYSVAERRGLQPAILILLVACGISFVPGVPSVQLAPGTIMGIVAPPLLYSAALHFSPLGFVRNLRSILSLGVGLVVATTLLAGLVAHWLMPAIGLATAFALGAAVSPPDTASTVARGREFGVPRKAIDILTGESLINDAAALTLFGVAITAVTGGHELFDNPAAGYLYSIVVGTLIGVLLGLLAAWARSRTTSPTVGTAVNLVVPFITFLLAETVEASDVFAVVTAGFTVSVFLNREGRFDRLYAIRLQEHQTWPVVDTLLESFVFAYIGLQCRSILVSTRDASYTLGSIVAVGLVLLLVVILVRFAYMSLLYGHQIRLATLAERHGARSTARANTSSAGASSTGLSPADPDSSDTRLVAQPSLNWKSVLVGSWAGMRGILTLAVVASIPRTSVSGAPLVGRAAIQQVAFIVVLGTVVVLGVTLPHLARALHFDAAAEDEQEALMLAHSADAIQKALEKAGDDADGPARFDIARATILDELRSRRLDDLTAADEIHRIDLEQAVADAAAASQHDPPR